MCLFDVSVTLKDWSSHSFHLLLKPCWRNPEGVSSVSHQPQTSHLFISISMSFFTSPSIFLLLSFSSSWLTLQLSQQATREDTSGQHYYSWTACVNSSRWDIWEKMFVFPLLLSNNGEAGDCGHMCVSIRLGVRFQTPGQGETMIIDRTPCGWWAEGDRTDSEGRTKVWGMGLMNSLTDPHPHELNYYW